MPVCLMRLASLHDKQQAEGSFGHSMWCVCCSLALEPNSGYLRKLVFFVDPSQQADVECIAAASTLMLTCHDGAGAF